MRRIEPTNAFKRDYKRESKGKYKAALESDFAKVVQALATDEPLAERYRDHSLTGEWSDHRDTGEWSDHRDCHIKPDWVLIYRKPDAERLQLVRLGSHSELGL